MVSSEPKFSRYCIARRIKDTILRLAEWLCSLLNLPGFVRPIDYPDKVTGDRIQIRIGRRYTVITVNNRDYWFRRVTGAFDGAGYTFCDSTGASLDCILADIHVSGSPLSWWGRLSRLLRSRG